MSTLKSKYKDHFILFLEAGFIAVHQMDEPSAQRLFAAARLLNPESTLNDVAIGYLHLCKLELKKAISHFEHVLKKDPHNDMAKGFLAMSKIFSTDQVKEGQELLDNLLKSQDKDMQTFSKSSLEFIEKFMKKTTHK